MARTLDRKSNTRARAKDQRGNDAFLSIDERDLKAAQRDPQKKAFAAAARKYWRKAAPKSS